MNWETGYGDWIAEPVWDTLRVPPWLEKTALVLSDTYTDEDHTEIPVEGDDVPVVMQRVEIESAGITSDDRLDALARELRDACGLVPATRSKFESGLLARGLAPPQPSDLGPTAVNASMSTGELAFASLRVQVRSARRLVIATKAAMGAADRAKDLSP